MKPEAGRGREEMFIHEAKVAKRAASISEGMASHPRVFRLHAVTDV